MARNLSHNLKRMVAGLCAVMVVATQMIGPAGSSGLFSDSSIVASAEGAQQYEVSPGDESEAGTVTESVDPDNDSKTYTATAKDGYSFVKFVYDIIGEQFESTSNTITFGYADVEDLGNIKAIFEADVPAAPTVVSAPAAVQNLKYTGQAQDLVTAGTASEGAAMKYAATGTVITNTSDMTLAAEDVKVGNIYSPTRDGVSSPKMIHFPNDYDVSYNNATFKHNGSENVHLFYDGDENNYKLSGKESEAVLTGYNALMITAVDNGNKLITVKAVNTETGKGLDFVDDIPKGTDMGSYTVFYKAVNTYNGTESDIGKVTATIAKGDSTYNVTAKSGLAYDGDEHELVTTTGKGGTISYAIAPEGKSIVDVVKRDVWEAIVPEVGKVYTPDLKGSQDGSYGVSFDKSYSISVDGTAYTLENDNNPVRLMYEKGSEKYQILDVDGSHDVKDGCDAILVTEVNKTNEYIVGTFVNSADYVSPNELSWNTTAPTAIDAGDYTVAWKVDGDDNYNDKAPAKVTAKISGSEATITIKGKDFVVTDSKGKEAINPTTPAGEGTDAVYTLSNGSYRVFSNETLVSRDDRFEMSEREGSYTVGGKTYSHRYIVDLVNINNDDDVPDEITVEHVHEISVTTNTAKDAVVAECTGETGETITSATLAQFNIADSYYFGDYPTEEDVTIDNDNTFGYTANVSDFYFTEKGNTAKLQPSDMELGKQYSVNMYVTVYDENNDEVGVYRIFKDVNYAARPFNECTFKIGDTTLEVQGDAQTGYYVEAPENILTYNKQSQLPNVTVTAGASSTALVKDTDFVITSESETKNAGAHTATIKAVDGSEAYDQTPVTVKFTIDKAENEMSIAGIDRIYNGVALDTSLMDETDDYIVTDPQGVLGEEGTVVSVPSPSTTYDRKSAGKQVVEFTVTTPNYVEKKITVESTISKRDATITTSEEQQTVTYGDSFSIAYTLEEANEDRGFVESDFSKLATGMLTFTGDKGRMTNIGSYNEFVLKTQNPPAASKNYNLTLNNESAGTLVIGKRALTADMFSAGERIYDNKDLTIPLKAEDKVGGTNVLQASDYVVSGQTTGKTPGTYTVTINASENGNYSLESPISLTWKVVPAEIERFMNVKDSYSYNTEIAPNIAVHTSGNDPKVGFTPGGSIQVAYYKIKDGVDLPAADADEDTFRAFIADSNKVTSVSSFNAPSIGNYILKAYSTSSYVTGDAFKLVNIHKYDEGINNNKVTVWNLYDRTYGDNAIKVGSPYEVCISHKGPAEDEHYLGVKKSGFYKINYAKSDTDLGVGKTPTKEQKYNVTSFNHINIVDASGDVKNYSGDSIKYIQVSGDGNDIKVYDHDDILRAICYDHEGDKDVWMVTQAENGTLTIKAYTPAELLDDDIAQGNITQTAVNAGDYVLMMQLGDDKYEDVFYSRKVTISKRVATVTPNANQNMVYGEGFTGSVGYTTSNLVSGDSLNVSNIVEVGQKVQSSTDSQTPAYNFDATSKTNPAGQYDYKIKSGIDSEINPNYTVKLDTTNKFTVQPKDVVSDQNFMFRPIGHSVVYNASEQTVNPTFTYEGTQTDPYGNIVSGTDYDITGTFKGTNVGKYTMTLTAKGNYTGKYNVSWNITAADITSVVVDPDKFDYNAANDPQKSGIKVNGVQIAGQDTPDDKTDDKFEPLTEGTDYEIRYISADTVTLEVTDEIFNAALTNVKDIGSYMAIVKGKGNYKGYTMSNVFEIKKAQSSSDHYDVTFNGGKDRVYNGESVANGDFAVSANASASAAEKENPAITGITYYMVPTGTAITPETDLEKLVEGETITEIGPNVEVSSNDVGKYLKDGDYTVANIALVIDGQYFSAGVHEGRFKINGGQFSTDNGGFKVGNVSDNKRWKITKDDGKLYIDAVDPPVEGLTPMTAPAQIDEVGDDVSYFNSEYIGKYLKDGDYLNLNAHFSVNGTTYNQADSSIDFDIDGGQLCIRNTEYGNVSDNKRWKITGYDGDTDTVLIESVDAPAAPTPKDAGTYIAKLTVKSDSTEPSTIYKAFDIQKKAVNVTLGHEDITWGDLITKGSVYKVDTENGFVGNDTVDLSNWFNVFRTEQGGADIFHFDFNNASHNDAATYNIKAVDGTDDGKTIVDEYNAADNNYTINVTEGTFKINPYQLTDANVTIAETEIVFDGTNKSPDLTVTAPYKVLAGGQIVDSTTPYTLALGTRKAPGKDGYIGGTSKTYEAGEHDLQVVGAGSFTGTVKKTWTITKADLTVVIPEIAERTYDGIATTVEASLSNGSTDYLTEEEIEDNDITVTYKYEKKTGVDTWEEVTEAKDAGTYRVTAAATSDNFNAATATKEFTIKKAEAIVTLNAEDLTKPKNYTDGSVGVTITGVVPSDNITLPEAIDIGTGVENGTEITAETPAIKDIQTLLGDNYEVVIEGEPTVTIRAAKLTSVTVKTSYIKTNGGDEFVSPEFEALDENGSTFTGEIAIVKGAEETNKAGTYKLTVSDASTLDDTTDDIKLVWDVKELGTVELAATNTILYGDNVVLNFFATIENEDCVDGAYVLFKYNHYGEDVEVRVDVDKTNTNKGRYVFPCSLSALEMSVNVTAELYLKDMDEPISVKSRSISDYAHIAAQRASTEKERNVAKAMLNYGAYTQISQNYNTDSLPNAGLETDVSDVTVESNVNFVRPTGEVEGLTYTSSTGVFTSAPINRHYFKLAKSSKIEDYVFMINGVEVTPVLNSDGRYYIESDPIKAYKMDDVQNIVVEKKDGTPVFEFDYSMITYLKLASEKGNAAQKNQAKAMYNYYLAAVAYVNK